MNQVGYDTFEYIEGMADCREGKPAKKGASKSYYAGYGAEYQLEQIQSEVNHAS